LTDRVEPKRVAPDAERMLLKMVTSKMDSVLPREVLPPTDRELPKFAMSKIESEDPNDTASTTEREVLKKDSAACVMTKYGVPVLPAIWDTTMSPVEITFWMPICHIAEP